MHALGKGGMPLRVSRTQATGPTMPAATPRGCKMYCRRVAGARHRLHAQAKQASA